MIAVSDITRSWKAFHKHVTGIGNIAKISDAAEIDIGLRISNISGLRSKPWQPAKLRPNLGCVTIDTTNH